MMPATMEARSSAGQQAEFTTWSYPVGHEVLKTPRRDRALETSIRRIFQGAYNMDDPWRQSLRPPPGASSRTTAGDDWRRASSGSSEGIPSHQALRPAGEQHQGRAARQGARVAGCSD